MRSTVIAWTSNTRRSDQLARHFGATIHNIAHGRHGQVLRAPTRYAVQARRTWQVLQAERPDVIFVQNPPIFAVLVAALYARRVGARFLIDSHTGAFLSPKWRWSLGLHARLSREAITTIVTNNYLKRLVESWGANAFILGFIPDDYPAGVPYPLPQRFNAAVISTFAPDEPLDVVFDAARRLPEVTFHVTGAPHRLAPALQAARPDNCHLTGFLPYDSYVGLLRGADAIVDLTTRDHTLLMGAFEAMSLGTPLITSNWPILRDYFPRGAVHVPNTVDGVCAGVRQVQRDRDSLRQEVAAMRRQLHVEWTDKYTQLQGLLGECACDV